MPISLGSALTLCCILAGCAPNQPAPGRDVLKVGHAEIQIDLDPSLARHRSDVLDWVGRAAAAVSGCLGQFPVKHLLIVVQPGGNQPVGEGTTYGASRIVVHLESSARTADLRQDWVLTHEMFHLAFPTLNARYAWMMEGLSDYLEPVARARAGQITAQDVWREMVEGMPQGLPAAGDRGLDNTRTWERVYWGGDLFWLLADVRVRARTGNRRSIDDAIRAILGAGGNGGAEWTLDQVLTAADNATGTTVLKDLHDELGPKPGHVDLEALWQSLGVKYNSGRVTFDDTAPWANIRAAITRLRPPSALSLQPFPSSPHLSLAQLPQQ